MSSPSPRVSPWVRRTAVTLAFALALLFAAPSLTATERVPDRGLDRPFVQAFAALWTAWLDLWEPIANLVAADGEEGTSGGSGGGGGGGGGGSTDPGGGSGLLDPNG